MAKQELDVAWQAKIKEFRASGQTQAAWCEENGIKLHILKHWLIKSKRQPVIDKANWVELKLPKKEEKQYSSIIVKIGSASIEVHSNFEPELLSSVVRVLMAQC